MQMKKEGAHAGAKPEELRGEGGEVTFGLQRLFVVTFSHLCSS